MAEATPGSAVHIDLNELESMVTKLSQRGGEELIAQCYPMLAAELRELRAAVKTARSIGWHEAADHVENHSCVASCCDAQPSGGEARELANCVRRAAARALRPAPDRKEG